MVTERENIVIERLVARKKTKEGGTTYNTGKGDDTKNACGKQGKDQSVGKVCGR